MLSTYRDELIQQRRWYSKFELVLLSDWFIHLGSNFVKSQLYYGYFLTIKPAILKPTYSAYGSCCPTRSLPNEAFLIGLVSSPGPNLSCRIGNPINAITLRRVRDGVCGARVEGEHRGWYGGWGDGGLEPLDPAIALIRFYLSCSFFHKTSLWTERTQIRNCMDNYTSSKETTFLKCNYMQS